MFIPGKSGTYNSNNNYFNGTNRYGQQVVGGRVAPGDWQLYNAQNGNSIQYSYNPDAAVGHRWTEDITAPDGQQKVITGLGVKRGPNGQLAWGRYFPAASPLPSFSGATSSTCSSSPGPAISPNSIYSSTTSSTASVVPSSVDSYAPSQTYYDYSGGGGGDSGSGGGDSGGCDSGGDGGACY